MLILAVIAGMAEYEMRTSMLQSWILSTYARKMSYTIGTGPSPSIVFPRTGPFDVRSGYTQIRMFVRRLEGRGFEIAHQARFSPDLRRLTLWGVMPPFRLPVTTRMTIRSQDGTPLFKAPFANHGYKHFDDIPPLAIKALLLIENRELDQPSGDRSNPVVDWDRLAKAALLYAGHRLGLPVRIQGGSTLATQMQKYRYSERGRTDSIFAKLRQMTGASLMVYRDGPDTREERRQIILDYMNSVPLAAAPRYGEVQGLGNGLYAWFGEDPSQVTRVLNSSADSELKAKVFKEVLELLCAVRAPSYYLLQKHSALDTRVDFYTNMLVNAQVIGRQFADLVKKTRVEFSPRPPTYLSPPYSEDKASNIIRTGLMDDLGVPGLYELDRLHLDVDSTIDETLQRQANSLFQKLKDPAFLKASGLDQYRLLDKGDPGKVIYGMILYERSALGNLLRVETDNLDSPFDINDGMKMLLGSTAKLRTLANYLTIVASLYKEFSPLNRASLEKHHEAGRDPITQWAADTLLQSPGISLDAFLQMSLDRKYSANPNQTFFTGGGIHVFRNFDADDNGRTLTVREATKRSVNLVYIRLMNDLVSYYEARLPYDTRLVMNDPDNPSRHKLIEGIAQDEAKYFLAGAYRKFHGLKPDQIVALLLGKKQESERFLTVLFYAWHRGAGPADLASWLSHYGAAASAGSIARMVKAYGNPRLNLSDYGYLLGIHPLDVWCAGVLAEDPSLSWKQVWERSLAARTISSEWLFKTRNRRAQDLRLRIRFEEDAFRQMTPFWQQLGFPFSRLVPSLATTIGSSGDRPAALAKLMGILLNDGMLRPSLRMTRLTFAQGTPYETVLEPERQAGKRVLPEAVARAMLPVLAGVVQEGTAIRLKDVYKWENGKPMVVGGKTGSGDNRYESIGRHGQVIASTPVSRTAVFVFYIGDRYYGAITAYVPGKESGQYNFTSALPVTILKLFSPMLTRSLEEARPAA